MQAVHEVAKARFLAIPDLAAISRVKPLTGHKRDNIVQYRLRYMPGDRANQNITQKQRVENMPFLNIFENFRDLLLATQTKDIKEGLLDNLIVIWSLTV